MSGVEKRMASLMMLHGKGVLAPLDLELARLVLELDGEAGEELALATAAASQALAQGHSCLALDDLPELLTGDDGKPVAFPNGAALRRALVASRLVASPADDALLPLVLDDAGRLYLRRYHRFERIVAEALRSRLAPLADAPDAAAIKAAMTPFFPLAAGEIDWQAVAVVAGLRSRLTVITGGPGTGKTHTVAALLATLLALAGDRDKPLRIRLAAPTGKAAARMVEALRHSPVLEQCSDKVRRAMPAEAATLHRLLGARPGVNRYRHHAGNPLPVDVLVVDEASMIDMPLMARLLDALPAEATLVLLGDRNQLASVEAGNVLSSICRAAAGDGFSPRLASDLERVLGTAPAVDPDAPALADHVIELHKNWRFGEAEGLAALAGQVLAGETDAVLDGLAQGCFAGVNWSSDGLEAAVNACTRHASQAILGAENPAAALAACGEAGLLTALRRGRHGSEAINEAIDRRLRSEAGTDAAYYKGRLLLVRQNDYETGLFNGDIGVVWPDASGRLVAVFPQTDGTREVPTGLLPAHTSAWAMTIHKAQGSEFGRVSIVLPPQPARVLGRELLYTAITRARREVTLVGNEAILRQAIGHSTRRTSGLVDKLQTGC